MTAQPLPATALIWPQALPKPLPRFFLLAALLHVWLVLMLGNAPGGTAEEGRGVYGSLNITLQGAPADPAGQPLPPQLPATPTGARGDADKQRFGGAVRTALPKENRQPGAAQLGDWQPVQGGVPDGRNATAAPEPTQATTSIPVPPAPVPPPVMATAPSTFGSSAELGLQRSLNPMAPIAPMARSAPDAVNGMPMPRIPPASLTAPPAVPAPQAIAVAAPLKQVTAAVAATQAVPEAALRAPPAAIPAVVPAVVSALAPIPAPTAQLPAASAERLLASRLPAERAAPAAALPKLGSVETAPQLAAVPAPVGRAAMAALATAPQPALQPVPAVAPLALPPLAAVAVAAPGPPAARAAAEPPAVAAPVSAPAPAALPTMALQSLPKPGPALPSAAAPAGQGAPDAGSRLGNDVATLPSTPASAPKRLNLELPRLRGGELSRYSTTGVLPALPRPPEVPDKLGSAIEKTAREDCRKAHAGAGLLAVVPLAVDALREGGCKW